MGRLERPNLIRMLERVRNVVKVLDETSFAEGIDAERQRLALGGLHHLRWEVNGEPIPGSRRHGGEEPIDNGLGEHDGQEPVLQAVVVEDRPVARGDQSAKPVIPEGPGRLLATGPAPEVAAAEEDLGPVVARLIERELGVRHALALARDEWAPLAIPPTGEQRVAVTALGEGDEKLLRENGVRIDIGAIEWHHQGG